MDMQLVGMQLLSGAVLGAILVMTALGFTIIFGMLGVVNFAHGALFMIGAYAGVAIAERTGSFWWALLIAPVAVGIIGLLIERFLIRPLYNRPADDSILLTFGLSYMLVEGVRIVFGNDGIPFSTPSSLVGVVNVGIGYFPIYRLFVIASVVLILALLWIGLEKTKFGLIVRAGSRDPQIMRVLGVDMRKLWFVVFGIGIGLTALGGILAAPMRNVSPEMGTLVLAEAFVGEVIDRVEHEGAREAARTWVSERLGGG